MKFQLDSENEPLIGRIESSVRSGRISHAVMVEGPSFLDKPAFARTLAKGILCPDHLGENCGRCAICDKIDHDNHEDIIYVRRLQGKATVGIDLIRQMQDQIAVKPNGDRYIVIIEESGLMTEEAQNCLLKTLEEPPGETVLVLLADNSEHLLPTIRSRCVRYRIEGIHGAGDDRISGTASELVDLLLSGSPYYRIRKTLGDGRRDRQQTVMLIDCMEQRCRQLALARDENGIPYSTAEICRCVDAMEEARAQLERGMTPAYALKRMLLQISL